MAKSSAFDEVRDLLAQAKTAYDAARGGAVADRAEQFDSHLATVAMVVDHTDDELSKES